MSLLIALVAAIAALWQVMGAIGIGTALLGSAAISGGAGLGASALSSKDNDSGRSSPGGAVRMLAALAGLPGVVAGLGAAGFAMDLAKAQMALTDPEHVFRRGLITNDPMFLGPSKIRTGVGDMIASAKGSPAYAEFLGGEAE